MEEEGSKTMVKGGVETTMRVGSKYERGLGERVQWQRATRFKPTRRHQMIRVKKKGSRLNPRQHFGEGMTGTKKTPHREGTRATDNAAT